MNLILTDGGRNAIANGANRGTNRVNVTDMAIGDARAEVNADDTGRTALRNERLRVAAGGTTSVDDRFAATGTFSAAGQAWDVTEVGLFAQIGGSGAKFLLGYFNVGPSADAVARVTRNTSLELAAVVQVVASPADVAATINAAVSIMGPDALLSLNLREYGPGTNNVALVAPARPRRWLVVAIGGGGAGGRSAFPAPAQANTGGSAALTGPNSLVVRADGGPGGLGSRVTSARPTHAGGTVSNASAGRAVTGAGAAGGTPGAFARGGTSQQEPTYGASGGLAIALVTPKPSATYRVTVGATAAGAQGGTAGGAPALFILEFLPTG